MPDETKPTPAPDPIASARAAADAQIESGRAAALAALTEAEPGIELPALPGDPAPTPETPAAAPVTPAAAEPAAQAAPAEEAWSASQYLARVNTIDRERREWETRAREAERRLAAGSADDLLQRIRQDPRVLRQLAPDVDPMRIATAMLDGGGAQQQAAEAAAPEEWRAELQRTREELAQARKEIGAVRQTNQLGILRTFVERGGERWASVLADPARLQDVHEAATHMHTNNMPFDLEGLMDNAEAHFRAQDETQLRALMGRGYLRGVAASAPSAVPAVAAPTPAPSAGPALAPPTATRAPPKTPDQMTEDERRAYALAVLTTEE